MPVPLDGLRLRSPSPSAAPGSGGGRRAEAGGSTGGDDGEEPRGSRQRDEGCGRTWKVDSGRTLPNESKEVDSG